ncbi:MAG: ABC transporter ATP-binding protein [Elusimicrobia bacterium]|nr:ABC transporter ATP-binding protein [Elusimicrobiota bacterium]
MEIFLKISNLTKEYKKSHLWKTKRTIGVKDLSLEIYKGEIFGLLGQNGAGKTTTLKLILGLLFQNKGEISLGGKTLPDRSAIQKTGFVPEVPYFPRHLTVKEVLEFYGLLSNIPKSQIIQRTLAVLKLMRMFEHKDKRIRECSKGMLQRLSLAQSLIHDPELLILDEPITGLDPLGLAEMRELLLDLNSKGKTILFSSHIIAEVEKIAHRVGILVDGKLVKCLNASEWNGSGQAGKLEKIYVDTVKEFGVSSLS